MNKIPETIELSKNRLRLRARPGFEDLEPDEVNSILETSGIKSRFKNRPVIQPTASFRPVIAEAGSTLRAELTADENIKTLSDLENYYPVFNEAGEVLSEIKKTNRIEDTKAPATYFLKKHEIFLKITRSTETEDLFGKTVSPENPRSILYNSERIIEEKAGDQITYQALRSGYVVLKNGALSIESPMYDVDDFERNYIFYPIRNSSQDVYDDYINTNEEHRSEYPDAPLAMMNNRENSGENIEKPQIKEICAGVRPVQGRDAVLTITAQLEQNTAVKDLRDIKKYITVRQHEIIAEKIPAVEGEDGLDIYGRRIEVKAGKDKILKFDNNIREEYTAEKILYTASVAGVLYISDNAVKLTEALIISGSVDYSTGNIDFEKDVYVKKDIKPKFRVNAGGSLIVKGSIEEGASIKVKGDLTVEGGIVGSSTTVKAEGNAIIKFVQDADIYASKDVHIQTSLIGGRVYAGRKLTVSGKKGSKKNQVFGGEYYSFSKMDLHSAGSEFKSTLLCCGYNPYVQELIYKVDGTVKSFELQISKQINKIGFNINSPAAVERIKNMPDHKKKELKEKLTELKRLTQKYNSFKSRKQQLIENLFSDDPDSLEIIIREKITPDTVIKILGSKKPAPEKKDGSRICLGREGIEFNKL